jgi:glycosyltransferase involved in cell wall biosynthesis
VQVLDAGIFPSAGIPGHRGARRRQYDEVAMSRILHALSFSKVGGVEAVFEAYLASAEARRHEHHVLLLSGQAHAHYESTVAAHAASVHSARQWHGLGLPRFLRPWGTRSYLSSVQPGIVVIYNQLVDRNAWQARHLSGARLFYYERGAAWERDEPRQAIRENLDSTHKILCNSRAAARILALKFDVPAARCEVIYNPLRLAVDGIRPASSGGRFRIGMAGRMVPVKGMVIGLHALKVLVDQGAPAELVIAGSGPEANMLRDTVRRLGLGQAVTFSGVVKDMAAFYRSIDVLLCPSLRESLGNVAVEAGAAGCPVICSAVDGLPEVVVDGVTGICIQPTLPAAEYYRMGVQRQELPSLVYDPASDSLRAPLALSPESVAAAATGLIADPSSHARMREAAVRRVGERFTMERYMAQLESALAAPA